MTQFGEGMANATFKQVDPEDKRPRIKIRVYVFFDGTGNNRDNIDQRLLAKIEPPQPQKTLWQSMTGKPADPLPPDKFPLTAEERAWAEQLKQGKSAEDIKQAQILHNKHGDPGEDNSYEAYYTNVVKMDRHTKDTHPDYTLTLKTYIDGSGTIAKGEDATAGYALGMGDSGVPEKVETGIRNVINLIKKYNPDKYPIIELLTLDVFGFSRGATGARKFIHDALFGARAYRIGRSAGPEDYSSSIRAQLEDLKYTIEAPGRKTGVQVCFAGLYDTVSSYGKGVPRDNDDNVAELSLNAVFHAQETFHLTAANEHRVHFSLTNISSAGRRGTEISLPGAHSDIGGGYRETEKEQKPILGTTAIIDGYVLHGSDATPEEIEEDRAQLIEAGWFRPDPDLVKSEINVENHDKIKQSKMGEEPVVKRKRVLSINRHGIKNGYSKIPLAIMVKQARAKGVLFKETIDDDESVPDELSSINGVNVPEVIDKYMSKFMASKQKQKKGKPAKSPPQSEAADWHFNDRQWIKTLRHDYFHFSSSMSKGYDPRREGGRRVRRTYRG